MGDTFKYEVSGEVLAEPGERYQIPGSTAYLLPRMPHQNRRMRAGELTRVEVHRSFTSKTTRERRAIARGRNRSVWVGVHDYSDAA